MPPSLDERPRVRHPPTSWQSILRRLLPEPWHPEGPLAFDRFQSSEICLRRKASWRDRWRVLRSNLASDRERPHSWSGNRSSSLVTVTWFGSELTQARTKRGSYVDVGMKAMIPRIGTPSSRAVLADIMIWMPAPYDSMKPGGWPGRLNWLATHSKLSLAIVGSLHVSELVGAFLADVVETARDHHFSLSRQQGITGDLDGQ